MAFESIDELLVGLHKTSVDTRAKDHDHSNYIADLCSTAEKEILNLIQIIKIYQQASDNMMAVQKNLLELLTQGTYVV